MQSVWCKQCMDTFLRQNVTYMMYSLVQTLCYYPSVEIKYLAGGAFNFIEKQTLVEVFSFKFCAILEKTYFEKHLRQAASVAYLFSRCVFNCWVFVNYQLPKFIND